jgi:hypothetical protein
MTLTFDPAGHYILQSAPTDHPGSTEQPCDRCGNRCFLGPKQAKIVADHPQTTFLLFCELCVLETCKQYPGCKVWLADQLLPA